MEEQIRDYLNWLESNKKACKSEAERLENLIYSKELEALKSKLSVEEENKLKVELSILDCEKYRHENGIAFHSLAIRMFKQIFRR